MRRARLPLLVTAAVLVMGLLTPSAGLAAPTKDEADGLIVRGVEHYKHQEYEGARVAFVRAFELSPRTALLFNLALAEAQCGHSVDAVKHFRRYLSAADAALDKVEAIRTKWLPRAEASSGLVRVDAGAGATIVVDGEWAGTTPLDAAIPVEPGEHRVEVRRGGTTLVSVVNAGAGIVTPVIFAAPEEARGATTATPSAATPPDAVAHHRAPDRSTAKVIAVASVGGAAALAGVISVVFAVSSGGDANYASDLRAQLPGNSTCSQIPAPSPCSQLTRTLESQYYHRDLAYGFGIAAGALLVTDVLLVILWPSPSSNRALASHLAAGPAASNAVALGWNTQF